MVDFTLTPRDQELVDMAREEALITRKYGRYYDLHEDELEPEELPEAKDRPDPHALLQADASGTSGPIVTESLLHMEYPDVRMRRRRSSLGDKIVNYAGNADQVARWGNLQLSIAITEPGAGSDPSMIRGTARYDTSTDEWILNAEKIYCSSFGAAKGAVVMLRGEPNEKGVRPFLAFVVEKGTPGLTQLGQVQKMGIRAWDTEDFVLQDCRVPSFNKLDVDFKKLMLVFNNTRPMVAAYGLKLARNLLDLVHEKFEQTGGEVDYRRNRNARSAVQDRLVSLEALHDATRLSILYCKWREQNEGSSSGATMVEAAMAKVLGGAAARRITQECIEMLGSMGLSEEYLAEKWFRDARIFDIFEGAGDVNRLIVARSLLHYSNKELN
jgi:acyl-CoA dehydrogenase